MARQPKPSGQRLPDKGKPVQSRSIRSREKLPHFLIVCEGEETEANYFKSFRLNVTVKVIGTGYNTVSLVVRTKELRDEAEKAGTTYKEVWVVFDRDDFPADDFNNAIEQAEQAGFSVAYSNEAFELWYVLHFDYLDSGIPRNQYQHILSEKLGKPYKKNDLMMYHYLEKRQFTAIENAKRLLNSYKPECNPVNDNPSTTVHQLVMKLNEYLV